MSDKENVSINHEALEMLKLQVTEAYNKGYRQGMENGFTHAIDISIKTFNQLKSDEIIKKWCDDVMITSGVLLYDEKT